jgi:pimeloyl-ACP methyl ester carboxylesterase
MITVILPGYSPHNKDWALAVAEKLTLKHEIRPVFWDHWTDPEKRFNPSKKAQDVIDILLSENVNIIAKSVGTLVAALVVKAIPKRVERVILCGIPTVSGKRLGIFKEAFNNFPSENVICFQNTKDPFASDKDVKAFLGKVNRKIKVVEKERHDHNYPYFEDFQSFLEK